MKTLQLFRIYFTINSDNEKDGKAPLYTVVTINKGKMLYSFKAKDDRHKYLGFWKRRSKGHKDRDKRIECLYR